MPVEAARVQTAIAAPPAAVWKALMTPSTFKQFFFGSDVETDWRVGSPIRFRGEWKGKPYEDKGRVEAVDENARLAFTHWSPLSGLEDVPESYHVVSFELQPIDTGTEVTLTQVNRSDDEPLTDQHREEYARNWTMVLEGLKKAVESRSWSPPALLILLAGMVALMGSTPASAQLAFQHHYISKTFPRLGGFGQSVAGDFTNDGRVDYLIGQHFGTREKRQYLFVNTGTPTDWPFHLVTTENTGDGGVNALDVDRDGWLDIVSSGSWFRNSRNPSVAFTRYIYDSTAFGGHDMVIADIDRDGRPDVVVNSDKAHLNGGENGLFWFRIPADPTQRWIKTRIGKEVHSGVWPAGISDIDGDGDLDVFNRAWYENADGKGARWVEHDNVGFGRRGRFGYSQQSALVDVDGDRDLDIVHGESDYFDDAQIQWSENADGKGGRWIAHPLPMQGEKAGDFHSLAARDFDGDGDIDVFAAESEWMATRARWFIWENVDGKGTFERRTILEGLGAHNAVVADMDGDGDLDIVSKEFAPASWNRLGGGQHADLLENRSVRHRR